MEPLEFENWKIVKQCLQWAHFKEKVLKKSLVSYIKKTFYLFNHLGQVYVEINKKFL